MTKAELIRLSPGDSLIGAVVDDEVPVVDVEHDGDARVAWVRSGAAVVPFRVVAGGPEIRGVRHG